MRNTLNITTVNLRLPVGAKPLSQEENERIDYNNRTFSVWLTDNQKQGFVTS